MVRRVAFVSCQISVSQSRNRTVCNHYCVWWSLLLFHIGVSAALCHVCVGMKAEKRRTPLRGALFIWHPGVQELCLQSFQVASKPVLLAGWPDSP
jgi:hypothetical protein